MANTGRTKSEKRREERRRTILTAAMDLFTHLGYEKTTMQQVVKKAGTSIGNCYFYFPNKEALLHALVEELIHNVWAEVEELIDEGATNVMELALATNTLLRKLLHTKMYLLFFKGSTKARLAVMGYYRNVLRKFFELNPSLIEGLNPDFAAIAWEGCTLILFDHIPNQQLETMEEKVIPFLIRWNLRAINCESKEIELAMDRLGYRTDNTL